MAAGGKAPDADLIFLVFVLSGVGTDPAEGALGVEEFVRVFVLGTQAVFEDEGANAAFVEPFGSWIGGRSRRRDR
jgi:hypothetical protein